MKTKTNETYNLWTLFKFTVEKKGNGPSAVFSGSLTEHVAMLIEIIKFNN